MDYLWGRNAGLTLELLAWMHGKMDFLFLMVEYRIKRHVK